MICKLEEIRLIDGTTSLDRKYKEKEERKESA